jgi:hypothetical protein
MSSSQWASLDSNVRKYADIFIDNSDELATDEDHIKAVAFRVLSSGALEEYVEERCRVAARDGIDRLKRGEQTSTGRALSVWWSAHKHPREMPIHEADVPDMFPDLNIVLRSYLDMVAGVHGLNERDFQKVVHPIGVRQVAIPAGLGAKLQALSLLRDPAVHVSTSHVRQRLAPSLERAQIFDIVAQMRDLDEAITVAQTTFPIR